jgi:hypothetical protein
MKHNLEYGMFQTYNKCKSWNLRDKYIHTYTTMTLFIPRLFNFVT